MLLLYLCKSRKKSQIVCEFNFKYEQQIAANICYTEIYVDN